MTRRPTYMQMTWGQSLLGPQLHVEATWMEDGAERSDYCTVACEDPSEAAGIAQAWLEENAGVTFPSSEALGNAMEALAAAGGAS